MSVALVVMCQSACYHHVVHADGPVGSTATIHEPNLPDDNSSSQSTPKTVPSKTVPTKKAP
jgi:hypothetical protein